MKKVLCFAAAAMTLFASCQKTEIVYNNDGPQEISFFAVNKVATKAPIDGADFPTTDKMNVAAYLAAGGSVGNYFGKTVFSKSGTFWTGSRYWPITASTINFLAVSEPQTASPVTSITFDASAEAKGATIQISGNDTKQYDLMYAVGQGKCAPASYPKVDMQFRHALTWLFFTVQSNVAGVVTVNSITVNNTACDGTLNIDNSSNYAATGDVNTTTATIGASWVSGTKGSYTVVGNTTECTAASTQYDFGSLLVLPTTSESKSFTINYTLKNGSEETTFDYTYSFTSDWKMSSKYTYNINIGLTAIEINPSVTPWTEESGVVL